MAGLSLAATRVGPPTPLPVAFTIDNDRYVLPRLDTRTWLDALVVKPPGCWMRLIPTLVAGDGPQLLNDRLCDPDDALDLDDLEHVAEQVLSIVLGVDLYPACQLALSAYTNWLLFDAWCCTVGFDPLTAPVTRTLAAVWGWRLSLCGDKADLAKLEAEVWVMPPPTTASGKRREAGPLSWSDEVESAAFEAVLATIRGQGQRAATPG